MAYNYLDYIRDQYRRNQFQGNRSRPTTYRGINTNPTLGRGDQAFGSYRGEPLGRFDSGSTGNTGTVILGRQGFGQNEGNLKEDAVNFNRPRALAGSGITNAEYRNIYGRDRATPATYDTTNPAIFPAPSRQAIDTAVAGNDKLGNTGPRSVYDSNSGRIKTFLSDGTTTSRRIPLGSNVTTTDNGHTVIDQPTGHRTIISAQGNEFTYKPGNLADNTKDFTNPVLNPQQAGAYLGSTSGANVLSNLTNNYSGPAQAIAPPQQSQFSAIPAVQTDVTSSAAPTAPQPGGRYVSPVAAGVGAAIGSVGSSFKGLATDTGNVLSNVYQGAKKYGQDIYENL